MCLGVVTTECGREAVNMGTRRVRKVCLGVVETECGREEVTMGTRRVRKDVFGCGRHCVGQGRGYHGNQEILERCLKYGQH